MNMIKKTAAAVLGVTLLYTPAWGQDARSKSVEPAQWYGQASIGMVVRAGELRQTTTLAGALPIQLEGRTSLSGSGSQAIALGRQWHGRITESDPEPTHWRLEGEWWQGRMDRGDYQTGQFKAKLSDSIEASGLFINAMVRVAASPTTRWWVGGGLGQVRVSVPDASAASPTGCGCLAAASGSGAGFKLKTSLERRIGESSAVYAEAAYTRLPDASSSGTTGGASVRYQMPTPVTLMVGLRISF